jgi:hypothetical protein
MIRLQRSTAAMTIGAVVLVASGCGDNDSSPPTAGGTTETTEDSGAAPVVDPGDGGDYRPDIDPADFVEAIDHPYLPFTAGSTWVYEGVGDDGETERIEVAVTGESREVMGVSVVVVRDTAYADGELVEDTYDWFAQDRDGNVWYFGEDTEDYEDGQVVSTEGAWEAGVDGALPGIVMPADPTVGDAYRQEFYAGEAEDMGEVLEIGTSRSIGLGDYQDVLVTEDWSPLEPEVVENKYYAPGVGLIVEEKTAGGDGHAELVEYTPGPGS